MTTTKATAKKVRKPPVRIRPMLHITIDPVAKEEILNTAKLLGMKAGHLIEAAWEHYKDVLKAKESTVKKEMAKDLR